ncbi:MAG: family 1 glycosylhydrolase, partial [Candidatus Omnitrophica bacterium]|nr:family 1 glycosylhydrolase [Candidatus Omnitrophota bacterium]
KGTTSPLVSIAKNMQSFVSVRPNLRNRFASYLRERLFNLDLIERLIKSNALDFIGINYYTRNVVEVKGWGLKSLLLDTGYSDKSNLKKNYMGWDIYPDGLYELLIKLKRYNLPILILENGVCTEDDDLRWNFIQQHLRHIYQAICEGVNVKGYIYWSLIDNYEWDSGFGPRFGLIEVDYTNYKRTPRQSALKFSSVCKSGQLE